MAISPATIESIKEAVLIEDVVGDFVSLKKKGHYHVGCCPFHDEKTPSFTVTANKGIYKCFGCGKAGDSFQFLMDLEGFTYPETLRFLASKYGIEIKEEGNSAEELAQQTDKESLHIVLGFAASYFENILSETDEGKSIGLSYFKERGFSINTIKKFNLGYSLEIWDGLYKKAIESGYSKEILLKAGLVIEPEDAKGQKIYDRFRARVIFPIHSVTGKVVAFGARILKTDKKQPKYLNSPETEVYHKSKVLYGLYQAKNQIRNTDNCYLVEGYTDVVSLHQEGVENVVASSGTSLTEDQIKLIKRYTENITVLYDGDPAGLKASLRGIDMILSEGMDVKVVLFPEGEDPDSYIKKVGGDAFTKYINSSSKDFITFKTELALSEAGNDPLKKAGVIKEIVQSISRIPDSIKRAVFFNQCSKLLDIEESILISEFNKIQLSENKKRNEKQQIAPEDAFLEAVIEELEKPKKQQSGVEIQEQEIIRLLLKYGNEQIETTNFATYILSEIEDTEFTIPLYKNILNQIKEDIKVLGVVRDQNYFTHPDQEIKQMCIGLVTDRYSISEHWVKHEIIVPRDNDILPQIAYSNILRLKFRSIKFLIKENLQELQKAEASKLDVNEYISIHMQLKEAEKEIAKMLGIVISS